MAGKNNNDRELASQVRSLCLNEIKAIFEYEVDTKMTSDNESFDENKHMYEMKKQLILKMSTSILPRLNELSGPDGGEIPIPIYNGKSKDDTSTEG